VLLATVLNGILLRKLRLILKSVCPNFEGGKSLRGTKVRNLGRTGVSFKSIYKDPIYSFQNCFLYFLAN
jgi:hypothetical protein